jgi:zinc-binding in reverse transcriptase
MTQEFSNIWWDMRISLKIKVFMWLTSKKKILTKENLTKRGWQGVPTRFFCSKLENMDHLLVQSEFVRQIWFWMGICQDLSIYWYNLEDVLSMPNHCLEKKELHFLLR